MTESIARINHDERARQLHLFLGMVWERKITPMNIDYYQEFEDKLFLMGDGKLQGADMQKGQRIAIERGIDAWCETGRNAVGFIYEHNTPADVDVLVKDCVVPVYRWRGRWIDIAEPPTTFEFVNRVLRICGLQYLIPKQQFTKERVSVFAPMSPKYKD